MVKQNQSRARSSGGGVACFSFSVDTTELKVRKTNGPPWWLLWWWWWWRGSLSLEKIRKPYRSHLFFSFLFGTLTRNESTARIFFVSSLGTCVAVFLSLNGQIWPGSIEEWPRRVGMCEFTLTFLAHGQVIWKRSKQERTLLTKLRCNYRLRQTILKAITREEEEEKWKNKSTTFICRLSIV